MKHSWIIGGLFAACFCTVSAFAGDEDAGQPLPPPPGAMQLHALVGHWTGTGEMKIPGQDTKLFTIVFNCLEAAGGWAVRCDDAMTGKDVNYLETDIMGYDVQGQRVHWYAVTNAGEVHDQVGQWKDDKHFSVTYTGTAGTKPVFESVDMQLATPTTLTAKSVVTIDGKQAQSMTMTLAKGGKDKSSNPFKEKKK